MKYTRHITVSMQFRLCEPSQATLDKNHQESGTLELLTSDGAHVAWITNAVEPLGEAVDILRTMYGGFSVIA